MARSRRSRITRLVQVAEPGHGRRAPIVQIDGTGAWTADIPRRPVASNNWMLWLEGMLHTLAVKTEELNTELRGAKARHKEELNEQGSKLDKIRGQLTDARDKLKKERALNTQLRGKLNKGLSPEDLAPSQDELDAKDREIQDWKNKVRELEGEIESLQRMLRQTSENRQLVSVADGDHEQPDNIAPTALQARAARNSRLEKQYREIQLELQRTSFKLTVSLLALSLSQAFGSAIVAFSEDQVNSDILLTFKRTHLTLLYSNDNDEISLVVNTSNDAEQPFFEDQVIELNNNGFPTEDGMLYILWLADACTTAGYDKLIGIIGRESSKMVKVFGPVA